MEKTLWLPEGVSTVAPEIDFLFYFVYWVSVVLFVGVVGAMLFLAFRYRRRRPDERPRPVKESKILEVVWIVVPTILTLVVFNWGFRGYVKLYVIPPDAYEIKVTASQWIWQFEYPNGIRTTSELHVPADRPVKLLMSSRDVLHSFFVPAFRVKQDVLPDRYSGLWFEATKEGEYPVYCTEYCGTQHSGMLARVYVKSEADFREWLATGGGSTDDMPLPELGEKLYNDLACAACHSVDGSGVVGPSFQGLFGRSESLTDGSSVMVDENYLRSSILEPGLQIVAGYQNAMPPNYGDLTERELDALIAFIKEQ